MSVLYPFGSTVRRGFVGGIGLAVLMAGVVAPTVSMSAATADVPAAGAAVDLLTQANIRIDGAAASDFAGTTAAAAGDVNGDGVDDVIVGASFAGNNSLKESGSAYVLYGNATDLTPAVDLANFSATVGFRIDGAKKGDYVGMSAEGAGDVNGDGVDDLIVGAYGADNNSLTDSGSAYVVYGTKAARTESLKLGTLSTTAGFRIDGAQAYGYSASVVAGAGDVNGDGLNDVIIAAPFSTNNSSSESGSAYVVYGSKTVPALPIKLGSLTATIGFRIDGAEAYDNAGWSVAGAGDVNADGIDDVIVGAPAGTVPDTGSGSAYVVYGTKTTRAVTVDLGNLSASAGFRLDGATTNDNAGWSVAGAGDVNADGIDDVIVGAPAASVPDTGSGSAYVVYGSKTAPTVPLDLDTLSSDVGFTINGAATNDQAGESVAGAGDINADGFDDVIIAAYAADNNSRTGSGSAYVIYGSADAPTEPVEVGTVDSDVGFRIDGAAEGDNIGRPVAGAGDINGDGVDDVIVGASEADNNGRTRSGSAYVVYGTPSNYAPVAIADSYQVVEDATLTVATPGVLANDTDADDDVLTAELVTASTHGTATLSANGSFTYVPTTGYAGADSFTYKVSDGTVFSAVATVNIDVTAKPEFVAPAVTITGTAKAGETLTAVPSSSPTAGSVSYEWFRGPGQSLGTGPTLALTDELETVSVYVIATLSKPGYVSATVTSTTLGPIATRKAPTVSLTPASAELQLGESTTLTWSTTRATSVEASGDWSGSLATDGSTTLTPAAAGAFAYRVSATNANGTVTAQTAVVVHALPVIAPPVNIEEPPAVNVGLPKATLKITAKVAGSKKTKIRVQIRGLAPREKYTVWLSGRRVATGKADSKGVATVTIRKPKVAKSVRRTVKVIGSLPNRKGTDRVAIHPTRSR